MSVPNNVWLESWQHALPRPVSRQKRLFDYSKEAEKVYMVAHPLYGAISSCVHNQISNLTIYE